METGRSTRIGERNEAGRSRSWKGKARQKEYRDEKGMLGTAAAMDQSPDQSSSMRHMD